MLSISYSTTTDKPTIVNLTNHSYFNLTDVEEATIYNHLLQLFSDHYTVKNENNVSSGEIASVKNTPFDFSSPKSLGKIFSTLKNIKKSQ